MDVLTKEQRRKNMQAIRGKNTKIEVMLAKALWAKGYRYRKNNKTVIGKPDFTFKKYKIAVFCDSEFWHGKDWENQQKRIGTNKDFWINKIQNNINRDKIVNDKLTNEGWIILRFWGKDIQKNLSECVEKIEATVNSLKQIPYNNPKNLR